MSQKANRAAAQDRRNWLEEKRQALATADPAPLCLWCKHFYLSTGSRGYSEFTPGSEFTMDCAKGHWHWKEYGSEEQYRACILTALHCEDYEVQPHIIQEIEKARAGRWPPPGSR